MVDPGHPDIDTHTLEAAVSCQGAAVAWGDTHRSMAGAPRNQDDALSYDDLVEEVEGAVEVVAEEEVQEERRMVAEGGEDGSVMGWVRLRGDHLLQWTLCL